MNILHSWTQLLHSTCLHQSHLNLANVRKVLKGKAGADLKEIALSNRSFLHIDRRMQQPDVLSNSTFLQKNETCCNIVTSEIGLRLKHSQSFIFPPPRRPLDDLHAATPSTRVIRMSIVLYFANTSSNS
jgi:hypothetical protein